MSGVLAVGAGAVLLTLQDRAQAACNAGFNSVPATWREHAITQGVDDFSRGSMATYAKMATCDKGEISSRCFQLGAGAARKLNELRAAHHQGLLVVVSFLHGCESPRIEIEESGEQATVKAWFDVGVEPVRVQIRSWLTKQEANS